MRTEEAAAWAARLIVDEHCSWPLMRSRLAEDLPGGVPLPPSAAIESAVREHLALFCPDHAKLLGALRAEALSLMLRLREAGLETWLAGAVLNGAATEDSNIVLECFTDNPKEAEAAAFAAGIAWEPVDSVSPPVLRCEETLGWLHPIRRGSVLAALLPRCRALGVTLDVLPEASRALNPRRRPPDARQLPAEAAGRAGAEALARLIRDSRAD